jgi:hypothetical protein
MSSVYSHTERASLKPRERCRSRRMLVTLVATCLVTAGLASERQSPARRPPLPRRHPMSGSSRSPAMSTRSIRRAT